jgi:hypothetical protein
MNVSQFPANPESVPPADDAAPAKTTQGDTGKQSKKPRPPELPHYATDDVLVEPFRTQDGDLLFAVGGPGVEGVRFTPTYWANGREHVPPRRAFVDGVGAVMPPAPHGSAQVHGELFDRVLAFVRDHVDTTPEFSVGAAAFVLYSHVYGRFQSAPYLHVVGPYGSGKSRVLDVIGRVAYHAVTSQFPTPAVIYRAVERLRSTMVLDELDARPKSEMREVLRAGFLWNGRVLRCKDDSERNVAGYCVFGPKILGGQAPLYDGALSSRCVIENMSDVAVKTEARRPYLPESFRQNADDMQGRLLRWSLDSYHAIDAHAVNLDVEGRLAQLFVPLLTVTPEKHRDAVHALMARHREALRRIESDGDNADVISAVVGKWNGENRPETVTFRPKDVAKLVNDARGASDRSPDSMNAKTVGTILRRMGLDGTRDKKGFNFTITTGRLESLARQHGVPMEPTCT